MSTMQRSLKDQIYQCLHRVDVAFASHCAISEKSRDISFCCISVEERVSPILIGPHQLSSLPMPDSILKKFI